MTNKWVCFSYVYVTVVLTCTYPYAYACAYMLVKTSLNATVHMLVVTLHINKAVSKDVNYSYMILASYVGHKHKQYSLCPI